MPILAHLLAREIAGALHRGRKCGAGWIACCPAHEDHNPSLSLRDASDGTVLLHCHTGCSQAAVIDALKAKGLWPERERRWLSDAEFKEECHRRDQRREREQQAAYFCLALERLLLEAIERLPPVETLNWDDGDPARLALTRELAQLRAAQGKLAYEAVIFGEWQAADPKLTAALVHAGEERERRASQRIWRWIDEQAQNGK
jgi:hypothetical protein